MQYNTNSTIKHNISIYDYIKHLYIIPMYNIFYCYTLKQKWLFLLDPTI